MTEVVSNKKVKKNPSLKYRLISVAIVFLLIAGGVAYWSVSKQKGPVEEPVVTVPVPEPVVVVPEPEPEPLPPPPPPPPPPEPVGVSIADLAANKNTWPDELEIRSKIEVDIVYGGKIFGAMSFVQGTLLEVESIQNSGKIIGMASGTHVSLSAQDTSVVEWFNEKYGPMRFLELEGKSDFDSDEEVMAQDSEMELKHIGALNEWCRMNFENSYLKKGEDQLELYWSPSNIALVNFSYEAREVARHYLESQADYNGRDNYAACVIYDSKGGKLLGSGVFFMPSVLQ